jgi:hypothetical protein
MLSLMGKQRYWLFKHQKRRFVSPHHELLNTSADDSQGAELLGMEIKDSIDRKLVEGIFNNHPI